MKLDHLNTLKTVTIRFWLHDVYTYEIANNLSTGAKNGSKAPLNDAISEVSVRYVRICQSYSGFRLALQMRSLVSPLCVILITNVPGRSALRYRKLPRVNFPRSFLQRTDPLPLS